MHRFCRKQSNGRTLFASLTIGILEYWSTGMMGLNEFYRFYKKYLFRFYPQYSIIPSFHYSMLHCNVERQLKTIISIDCAPRRLIISARFRPRSAYISVQIFDRCQTLSKGWLRIDRRPHKDRIPCRAPD